MALHPNEVSMLGESLPEYLALAELGMQTAKPAGGILGYPTTALLLAVVDTIGSYFREHPTFRVRVDGVDMAIAQTSDHILILNSEFFGFKYTEVQLRDIYRLCRSPLTHNAVVGNGHMLVPGSPEDVPFEFNDGVAVTSVAGLYEACRIAVEVFLGVVADVVPSSAALEKLRETAVKEAAKRSGGGGPVTGSFTVNASAMGPKS